MRGDSAGACNGAQGARRMTDREALLDEIARCYMRAAVDALLHAAEPIPQQTNGPHPLAGICEPSAVSNNVEPTTRPPSHP
jgi:hypothetical protein